MGSASQSGCCETKPRARYDDARQGRARGAHAVSLCPGRAGGLASHAADDARCRDAHALLRSCRCMCSGICTYIHGVGLHTSTVCTTYYVQYLCTYSSRYKRVRTARKAARGPRGGEGGLAISRPCLHILQNGPSICSSDHWEGEWEKENGICTARHGRRLLEDGLPATRRRVGETLVRYGTGTVRWCGTVGGQRLS